MKEKAGPTPSISFRQAALWLGLAIFGCYVWSIGGNYHFDDSHSVETNLAVRSITNIPSFWTDTRTSSFIPENRVYRPLVYTFYSFCWLIGGGSTWPFHIMKMLMHLGVCLGLFFIWRRLWSEKGWFPIENLRLKLPLLSRPFSINPSWAAFFLALIFAVHPAGSECVDYISATTSLQCAMFYIGAFCAYLRQRDAIAEGRPSGRWLGLALFLYFLSVASKEEGITLLAMVAVTEFFLYPGFTGQKLKAAFKRMLPFAVTGVVLAAWIVLMHPSSGDESRGYATWDSYFMTQWRAYLWYMRIWFWPFDLNADYATVDFAKSITDAAVIQAIIGNGLLIAFAWLNRRRFPAMLFGLLWFYITISPASSVVKLAEAINEHRMYLAYIGFVGGTFTVLLYCAEHFFASDRRAQRLGWIYAFVMAGLVIGTQARNQVWANDEALWTDTVEKNPNSGRALNNLALVYLSRGEHEKAVEYLERCERNWASYMYCPLNRGVSLQAIGLKAESSGQRDRAAAIFDKAEAAFKRAYELNPRSVHSNFHMGQFYQDVRKDCGKAVGLFKTSVEVTGGRYPAAEQRMAACLVSLKRTDEAVATLQHALEVEPGNQGALFELARAQLEGNRPKDAAMTYDRILELNPRHLQAWYNSGVARLAINDLGGARKAFEQTLQLDPNSTQGLFNLSYVAEKQGDGRTAVEAMRKLASLDPARTDLKTRLQQLRNKFGAAL
jgi:tetratricopeptide (TPR) repeat protein